MKVRIPKEDTRFKGKNIYKLLLLVYDTKALQFLAKIRNKIKAELFEICASQMQSSFRAANGTHSSKANYQWQYQKLPFYVKRVEC